jgi:hypothetical protein
VGLDKDTPDSVAGRRTARFARDQQVAPVLAKFRFNRRKQRRLSAAFNAFE